MTVEIKKEHVETLLDTKFIKVYDLQYAEGKHYYDATRRAADDLVAVKSNEEFKKMLPDAVTCAVILVGDNIAPRLLLSREFRYPAGRFLLSPPAGLMDPEDKEGYEKGLSADDALISTAKREIWEETGLKVSENDRIFVLNQLLFSTPGMTDESNGLVCAVINVGDADDKRIESILTTEGAVGSEVFDGFVLVDEDKAREIIKAGRDSYDNFFSVYTWCVLMYFVSGMWK